MSITVRYFASLREHLGRSEDFIDAAEVATIADVLAKVAPEVNVHILAALNHAYVSYSHPVADGDEVAFFPRVTGG